TPGATCLDPSILRGEVESWRDSDRVDRRVTVRVRGSSSDARSLEFVVEVEGEIMVERAFERVPGDCADLHAVVALAVAIALDDTLAMDLGIVATTAPAAPIEQVRPGEGDL